MLDRHFVNSFLLLNHLRTDQSDAELRDAFFRAGWSLKEVERALKLIRNEDPTIDSISDVNHIAQAITTGRELSSEDLSQLLGVDVVVDPQSVRGMHHGQSRKYTSLDVLLIIFAVIVAFALAVTFIWALMYSSDIAAHS